MSDLYTPKAWYWKVNGSTTQVYSSKSGGYVPVGDSEYVAWVAGGNNPTNIASETELGEVLAKYDLRPNAAGVLDGFLLSKISLSDQVQFKILFNHENRIRALEGKQAITAAQFINGVKALL